MGNKSLHTEARDLVDSEYESLVGITKDELWDYFSDQGFEDRGMLREESDYIHGVYSLK